MLQRFDEQTAADNVHLRDCFLHDLAVLNKKLMVAGVLAGRTVERFPAAVLSTTVVY